MKVESMTKSELREEIMYLKVDVEAKQKCINGMDKYIKELKEENKHSNNYTKEEVRKIALDFTRAATPSKFIIGIDERFNEVWKLNFEN